MEVSFFQVDSFTTVPFQGNPAAVCLLPVWPSDSTLQAIAAENNLSETAFVLASGDVFHLRWFTPVREVNLCGHATLAAAHVLIRSLGYDVPLRFDTLSGRLTVSQKGDRYLMDFPALNLRPHTTQLDVEAAFGVPAVAVLDGDDDVVVFENEDAVRNCQPNFELLKTWPNRGVVVTAPGREYNFVSRAFFPKFGIPEDPVTGSAHCLLAPYWAKQLGKNRFLAFQASARGGELECVVEGDRVHLIGDAVLVIKGTLFVEGCTQ
ncbi:MAG: PhzF family phenazine biosynthesis protein [Acidobacteria bacterium]|nr:PhzF family phenazine biosynthesis protein [Acidobacteriota bacterium]